jgi:hypothetical protein
MLKNNAMQQKEIRLTDILDQFPSEGKDLVWSIFDLDIMGDFEDNEYLDKVIMEIWETQGKARFFLTWQELCDIAKKITVLVSFRLVGCKKKETIIDVYNLFSELPNYPLAKNINPAIYDIFVDIDDGYLLGVYSKDKAIESRCASAFGPFPALLYIDEAET